MNVLYLNPCYNEVFDKETALYLNTLAFKATLPSDVRFHIEGLWVG